MFKFFAICCLFTIVNGQASVLPPYYNGPPDYPTSLYNPSSYQQTNPTLNAALTYQQEQNLQRQQALAAYQQQANAAGLPQSYQSPANRAPFTSNPSVNYSPQNLPAVSYQPQTAQPQALPQQSPAITYSDAPRYQPQSSYNPQPAPQTSYNPQGLQTISYQPSNEQPVAPVVTNYDPQPAPQTSYNPQPAYNPEEIAALQRQRDAELALERQRQNEIALQRQRESELQLQRQRENEQLAANQRQREYEINLRRQKEAEIAIQRERENALAVQAQRDAIAAAQRAQAAQAAQTQAQTQAQSQVQSQAQSQRYQPQSSYNPQPAPQQSSYSSYQPKPVQPATTEAPKVFHRPAEIFYSKIGEQLNGDYTFGYHTGKGENDNSFREEKRLPDGTVTGAYGFVDKNGKKHVVKYTAGKDGFKVEGDVNPDIAAVSAAKLQPLESTTARPQAPVYQSPPQTAYRPPVSQPATTYQPTSQTAYRPPVSQPATTYQPPPQPQTTPAPVINYNRSPVPTSSVIPSAYEEARAQIAVNRDRPIASAYQAPIAPSYHNRQNLGQNLSYRPLTRTAAAVEQPVGTHLATSASSYPAAARINSRAVRKLMQTRHRQQPVNPSSSIDTSASSSSSVVSEPIVKLKTSSSVQILSRPPPMVPSYQPINAATIRMARSRAVKAFTNSGTIETSASSQSKSYTQTERIAKKAIQPEVVKSAAEKVESRSNDVSNDKIESRSDNIESRSDSSSAIDFPSIAFNSFLARIK